MFRPGPVALPPGVVPGGLMLHVYGEDGRLLLARSLTDSLDLESVALVDADYVVAGLRPDEAMCVVIFDGDTGERITPYGTGPMPDFA